MKLEKKTTKSLRGLAWKVCSEYIRRRDKGVCFTCGKEDDWKKQNAGHFIHGHTKATFFNPKNIHCQCPKCNLYLDGNLRIYTIRMIDTYGMEVVRELDSDSKMGHTHNRKELMTWIRYYKGMLDKLKVENNKKTK